VTVHIRPVVAVRLSGPHAVQKLSGQPSTRHSFVYSLSGSFGEILGGKPVRVFLCDRPVSSIHPSNELMRRCLLRWEYETPRRAFCRIWQRFLHGSFKDRFSGHLATRCGIKCHSLAPKIARLLPGSEVYSLGCSGSAAARDRYSRVQWEPQAGCCPP
jgi:hypothetical protein